MKQEIFFSGDELELLNALDRSGCVLTDDGKFYCILENDKLPFNSRLPVRINGTYEAAEGGWKIAYNILPAARTMAIGAVCLVVLLAFAISGQSLTGAGFFAIFCAAMAINFLGQKTACMRRFENVLLHGRDMEL